MIQHLPAGDRHFFYSRILSASDLSVEVEGLYPALIWNILPGVAPEEMAAVLQNLFSTGCRYIVAGGVDCERWHDIADKQLLIQFPTESEQDQNFVMTSWHTGESSEDVTLFFVNNTNFEDHDFRQFLVLQFGDDFAVESQLKARIRKWTAQVG